MIEGFLNGYYRTGTTIVWWILQRSNPDCVIMYEPNSPGVYNELTRLRVRPDELNRLHGFPIYSPFFNVEREVFEEYLRAAEPRSVYSLEDLPSALKTLNPFNRSKKKIIIQSNQLHLLLRFLSNIYDCNYAHLCRHPAEVLYSHAESPSRMKDRLEKLVVSWFPDFAIKTWSGVGRNGKFEIKRCINLLYSKYDLESFLRTYTFYNYVAYLQQENDERGLFVRFEDLQHRRAFKNLASHLGLKLGKVELDRSKMFQCPDSLREKVREACDNLNLTEAWEEMGYEL